MPCIRMRTSLPRCLRCTMCCSPKRGGRGGNIAGLGSADAPAAPTAPVAAPQDLALYMPAPLPEEELHQPVHV
jgi:hypothetical protein